MNVYLIPENRIEEVRAIEADVKFEPILDANGNHILAICEQLMGMGFQEIEFVKKETI